jgi:hypothetical protein
MKAMQARVDVLSVSVAWAAWTLAASGCRQAQGLVASAMHGLNDESHESGA